MRFSSTVLRGVAYVQATVAPAVAFLPGGAAAALVLVISALTVAVLASAGDVQLAPDQRAQRRNV
jgi:hypothetical protein